MSGRRLVLPAAAVLFGLTACAATPAPAPQAANPPAAPAATTSTSTAPTPTATASAAPVSPAAPGKPAATPACPSAEEFEKLADLPSGWHFTAARCWKGWATADPEGPTPGDGVFLFQYQGGRWTFHSEGSGYHCADLGIREPAPFCDYS